MDLKIKLTRASYSKKVNVLSAAFLGTTLEFYDYSLYGLFVPLLSKIFFPNENEHISLLYSWGVFATGFIMRPLGSIVWGYIGDRYGRHKSFSLSMLLMSLATFVVSFLPSYAQMGVLAPLILILCRLTQGFAAGGEYITSFVYSLEHTGQKQKNFIGSFIGSGQILGFILGTFAFKVIVVSDNPTWNWRYAFFVGSLLGFVGLFIRYFLEETPEYKNLTCHHHNRANPFIEACKTSRRNIFSLGGLTICSTGMIYTIFFYLPVFFNEKLMVNLSSITYYSLIGQILWMIAYLAAGYLSDKINRKYIMGGSLLFGMLILLPFYISIFMNNLKILPWFYVVSGITLGSCFGSWCSLVNDSFPISHRLTGIAVGFSIVQAFVGGLSPLFLTIASTYVNSLLIPCYYLLFCMLSGCFSLCFISSYTETNKQNLGLLDVGQRLYN